MPTAKAAPDLLTPEQAATYLNVSRRWLKRAVYERRLAYTHVGRLLRFERTDLDAMLANNRVEAMP
jgi:excisionase family DNA binding protein